MRDLEKDLANFEKKGEGDLKSEVARAEDMRSTADIGAEEADALSDLQGYPLVLSHGGLPPLWPSRPLWIQRVT